LIIKTKHFTKEIYNEYIFFNDGKKGTWCHLPCVSHYISHWVTLHFNTTKQGEGISTFSLLIILPIMQLHPMW